MPTAYLKKLAKLNKVSVNKLEKFWSQAKEIAKSEGQSKQWGLITTIFQNKLKKEGYKIKGNCMKQYLYNGKVVTASSKSEAIKVIAGSKISKADKEYIFNKAEDGDKSILKLPKELLMIKNGLGNTPIHLLANIGVKEVLKLPKELLKIKNYFEDTPVHYLANNGVKEVLKLPKELLVIKDKYGRTPKDLL